MKNNQKWISCFSLLSGLLFSASAAMAESEVYYLHSDHLGTTQVVTNSAQATVWKANYRPFGETDLVQTQVTYPLRFPGQYYDQESGTYYNYYRDYDPTLGRYIQSDPIGLAGGLNTYAYVHGNPVSFFDPFGLICTTDRFGTVQCSTPEELGFGGGYSANGDNSFYPPTYNNARYNSCYSVCLKELEGGTAIGSRVVCPVLTAAATKAAGGLGSVAGTVAGGACGAVDIHLYCQRICSEPENCPVE